MDIALSKNNIPIRLPNERWIHITEEHSEMAGYYYVLYINFKKPSHADDSELTDDDVIIRYEKGEVIGLTILNASKKGTK